MKTPILFVLFFIFFSYQVAAQSYTVKGKVYSENAPIAYAHVFETTTKTGTTTDENGHFEITLNKNKELNFKFSALGFETKALSISLIEASKIYQIELHKFSTELEEIVITGTLQPVSKMASIVPVEVFQPTYFNKNPTPSMFEAIQIVNGVRPQINCNVCNTGDIHINGMEGPYTMILIDGMPIIGGLASVYGLNGIPNSMIEKIEIIKGPVSTLYGSEAVGGIINVITKKGVSGQQISLNLMTTSWLENQLDLGINKSTEKISNLFGVSVFSYQNPQDKNGDNFTDITLQNRISLFNKTTFKRKSNKQASIAARYIYEDRWGGELQWTPEFRGGDSIYGESIYTNRFELLTNYELPTKEKLLLQSSISYHMQNAVYGETTYLGEERIGFLQLLWDKKLSEKNQLMSGVALRYQYYDDNSSATGNEQYNEPALTYLPGIFTQLESKRNEKLNLLIGTRLDYHQIHGAIISPRLNLKYIANNNNILRFSFGNGFRVVNIFTEEHAALTGARTLVIAEDLAPENSYNINLNYQKYIPTKFGFLQADITPFYTYFTNKIVPDYETDDQLILYENIEGYAINRGISANMTANFTFPLHVQLGATYMDVFLMNTNEKGQLQKEQQLLTEKFSSTWAISYTWSKPKISIDYTGNIIGPMKLPIQENDFRPEFSPWYSLQNIQLTKKVKNKWEIYGGIKNLLNYTPPFYSIMRPHDPFDKRANDIVDNPNGYSFDPTYSFAPNQGRRWFVGLRWFLEN
jgi:outer membrane receptor for ferrienterochelin and colicins